MKFSSASLILLLLSTAGQSQAFTVASRRHVATRTRTTNLSMSTGAEDEVAALRAAAAKARADVERLQEELGKSSPKSGSTATMLPKKTRDEVKTIIPALLSEPDLEKQTAGWKELKDSKSVTAFGSANLRSFPVTLKMLEDRTQLTPSILGLDEADVNLDDFKYATLYVTGGCSVLGIASLAFLPSNIGATVCYLIALIPVLFLAVGSTAPAAIAGAIVAVKGGSKNSADGISKQDRIIRHEAAHFCCGYWCGLPIAKYTVEEDVARVEFAVAGRQFSSTEVAALSVTALAGLVGEAMEYKSVLPGTGTSDLLQLEQVFRRSAEFVRSDQQQDLTRWGALTSALLLRQNAPAYEKVVKAFAQQAPLEECIAILEE